MRSPSRRRGIANVVAAVMMLAMLFTVGTSYFLLVSQANQGYANSLVNRSNSFPGLVGENLLVTTVLLSNNHIAFYVNNTAGLNVNMTAVLVLSNTGSVLKCAGRGLPTGSGCSNTTPALPIVVNAGKGSATIDTGFTYVTGTTDTVKIVSLRGNAFTASWPATVPPYANQAYSVGPVTASLGSFRWLQPTGTVQSGYQVGGYPTVAVSPFTSNIIPITLTNNQGSATPTTFQQKVTWNPSSYQSYEASDLGNIRFCADSACATPLNAWLESCTPSCTPTATSASAWVKLTSSIAGGGGTKVIYMTFQSLFTDFDSNYWGEAPTLSGTYAAFDNGANTFNFYDNFAGTSLSLQWTSIKSSGGTVTINNGATFTTSSSTDYTFVSSAAQTYPQVAEAYMLSSGSVNPLLGVSTTQNIFTAQAPRYVPITLTNYQTSLVPAIDSSNCVPITITNSQSSATPNPFEQKVTFNPSIYQSSLASDLGNVRFYSDSACSTTQLYGWLESCTPSCTPTATSAAAWVKLTSSIAGSGGTLKIYMTFQSSSTPFDGNFWGEAPNLSGTYGQYDNGANVFKFYDNFAGTSLSSKWTKVVSSTASPPTIALDATSTSASGLGAMSISYRSSTTASGTNSFTINKPAGVVQGDLLIISIVTGWAGTTYPSGWTELWRATSSNDDTRGAYHVAGASEPTSYTFSENAGAGYVGAVLEAYSGVDNTTPIDVTTPAPITGSVATITYPSITTVTNNAWHLAIYMEEYKTTGTTPVPTGYTQRDRFDVAGQDSILIGTKQISPAGTVSVTTTDSNSTPLWWAVSVALRPAVASFSWTHTVGTGLSNSILVVGVSVEKSSGSDASTVTYNGVSMTKKVGVGTGTTQLKASLWYLLNPPSGAHTVLVTLTGTLGADGATGGAISFSGVDQSNPMPTTNSFATATAGTPSLSLTTAYANSWIMDTMSFDSATANQNPTGSGQVKRWGVLANGMSGYGSTKSMTTPGSFTMGWTGSDKYSIVAAEIKAAPSSLALDGYTSGSSTTSVTVSLTTTKSPDVLYLSAIIAGFSGEGISSITSTPSLTWTERAIVAFNGGTWQDEAWYAIWTSSGTISITVNFNGPGTDAVVVYGISGADTSSPFDTNAAVPSSASGSGTTASATISTSNANDFIIGALAVASNPALTVGSGFSLIATQTGGSARQASDEYKVVTTTQSSLAVSYSWTGTQAWGMIADAVRAAGTPGCTVTVNNGATFTTSTSSDWCFVAAAQIAYPSVGESYMVSGGTGVNPMMGVSTSYSVSAAAFGNGLYNGYSVFWNTGVNTRFALEKSTGYTNLQSATQTTFPAGIWQVIWSATGSEVFQDGAGNSYTGTDSGVTIANYGIYVGQSNNGAGSNLVQWGRMRAYPPSNTMPSISLASITGTAAAQCSGATTCSVTLTTFSTNDVIYVGISDSTGGNILTGVSDTSGLAWTQRRYVSSTSIDLYTYYAIAGSPLGSDSITATTSVSTTIRLIAIAITKANTASPFDPNLATAPTASGTSSNPATVTFTTFNANDMIIGTMKENTYQPPTAAAGYTLITCCTTNQLYGALEYRAVSTPGSYTPSFTLGGNDAWAEIGDAIRGANAAPTPNPFQQRIVFNPSSYSTYEASTLGNIRFCADSLCATKLYAWLESCTPSCVPTATSATVWVKLTSAIAGAGGTLTIYMDFMSLSTNFDGVYWGEAPNLSGTYGQYDNGANVFTFYDSFIGTTLNTSKWTTVKSSGGSVSVNNGATFTTAASSDWVFVAAAQIAYPSVAESYMVSESSSSIRPDLGVSTTYNSIGNSGALYTGYAFYWSSGTDHFQYNTAATKADIATAASASFPAGIWQVIWSAVGGEYFQDGAGVSYTGADSNVTPIANYGIYVGQSNAAAGNNLVQWGRMRAYPPTNVMPSTTFGSLGGGALGATTLYNGYNLNWQGGTDVYGVSTVSSYTVLSSQTQASFPAGIWTVTWSATGSEYFQDGAGLSYTGTDSSVAISNYGIYLGQTSLASGNDVAQWARMRAYPPGNVMPSTSFGTLSALNGNVIFSVVFTDLDPLGRGVTLWPQSSVTAITTVSGGQSQSVVVGFYIVDGLTLNGNGYPTGIVPYNSTSGFIRLPYRVPTTVYFGSTAAKGSSMNTAALPTDPMQILFTLTGQFDDKTLYGQTIPFPSGIATTATATVSVASGGTSSTVTVSGTNFRASTKSMIGWMDSTGKITTLTTFTTSSGGSFTNVTFQVPSVSAGYYTIIVSDYINSDFVTFQHT